jgi:dolichol kinase
MHFVYLVATAALVFLVLLASEFWWRKRKTDSELSRKFIHLTVGSFVAFWPFFLTWDEIRILSVVFILAVLVSKWLNIFQAIHSVQRPTWGEVYFAIVVGLLTYITHSKAIYAAALLQMSLADGMAAIVGVEYGIKKGRKYLVFGHPKTVIGTITFFLVSFALLFGYSADTQRITLLAAASLACGATIVENLAVAGVDNLVVPLLIALALKQL